LTIRRNITAKAHFRTNTGSFCDFMAKAGKRITSGIESGTDATPLGLGYTGFGVPRVASALLRQPWAEILIPVGDEEPSPPSSKIILPTTFSSTQELPLGNGFIGFNPRSRRRRRSSPDHNGSAADIDGQ